MDADPEVDVTVQWQVCIGSSKRHLRFNGAFDGIDGTTELGQYAVPGGISDPASMH
jgi:hypothetical protein